jgi:hypothetical protein
MKSLLETLSLAEGQIIALNSHLKLKARTEFNYAMIDQIKGTTLDATFIKDEEVSGRPVNKLDGAELNLQFYFVYPDIRIP